MALLPDAVQMQWETLPTGGYAAVFTHRTLGLLGRLVLHDVGPNQMELRSEVAGDPADPMTRQRQRILEPITAQVLQALQERGIPDALPPAGYVPPGTAPTRMGSDHVIASTLVQCEWCNRFIALLIYADAQDGTVEDHARLMYAHIQQVNLPTYVLGPEHPVRGRAEVLMVHPQRQPVQELTAAEFDALLAPLRAACCGHR